MSQLPNERAKEKVVVIGGGVIGAMCAWYLVEAGHKVTIVDRGKFGAACSYGNCGYVSTSHVLPLTQPGAIRDAIPALFNRNSPLKIRWKFSPALWHWLWKFSRQCNHESMIESAIGRHELLQSSLELYKKLVSHDEISCEWQERGLLFVFQTEAQFEHYGLTNDLIRDEFGVGADEITSDALERLEPALKEGLAGAWYYPEDCHLRPDKLLESMKGRLLERGVELIEHFEVTDFIRSGIGCCAVAERSSQNEIEGDAFVVATGAWTPFLNKHLGFDVPIQPGKGYSITMPQPRQTPQIPMIFEEHRVAVTPLENKFRIGSTMEFAGYDDRLSRSRLAMLQSSAKIYLHESDGEPVVEEWFGWRPMTWDGKPFIDNTPAMSNVWIAAGHNMLGMSMATGTGKLIQELIDGIEPHVDPKHFSVARLN